MSILGSIKAGAIDLVDGKDSITVKKVHVVKPFVFNPVKPGNIIVLKEDAQIDLDVTRYTARTKGHRKRTYNATIKVFFKKGFCTDGATTAKIPIVKDKIRPYIEGDNVYNAGPFIHDGLYMLGGEIDGAVLSREESDDILRGIWRESKKLSRSLAGVADKVIELAAGGENHWGNGKKCENAKHFSAKFTYI